MPQGNSINAVRFAGDKRHGWAVGADGAILRTQNGGFEWEEQESPANTTLYGLYVRDKSHAVISGARGIILTTANGGRKWVPRPTGVRDHLFSLTFSPADPSYG
ncbi:MAG: WD40/YVTN/BNR-like repeat-containing protein, partial [Pyrinomonadaceae bacterium]